MHESERTELLELARGLPHLSIGIHQLANLEMLANGAYSSLTGFLTRPDYPSVIDEMRLTNGLPWSIPITSAISAEQAATIAEGSQAALVDSEGVV